jgi:hypothetical protein
MMEGSRGAGRSCAELPHGFDLHSIQRGLGTFTRIYCYRDLGRPRRTTHASIVQSASALYCDVSQDVMRDAVELV